MAGCKRIVLVAAASLASTASAAGSRPWSTGCTCYRETDTSLGSAFHPPPIACRTFSNLCANHWNTDGTRHGASRGNGTSVSSSESVIDRLTAYQALERLELLREAPVALQIGRRYMPVLFHGAPGASDVTYGGPSFSATGFERVPVPQYVSGSTWTVVDSLKSRENEVKDDVGFDVLILQRPCAEKDGLEFIVGLRPLDVRRPLPICEGDIVCASQMVHRVFASVHKHAGGFEQGADPATLPFTKVLVASGAFHVEDSVAVRAQADLATAIGGVLGQAFGPANIVVEKSEVAHDDGGMPEDSSMVCMKFCEQSSIWKNEGVPRPRGIEYLWKEVPNNQMRVCWVTTIAVLVVLASWHGSFTQHNRLATPLSRSITTSMTPSGVSTALPSQAAADDWCSPLPGGEQELIPPSNLVSDDPTGLNDDKQRLTLNRGLIPCERSKNS